MNKDTIKGIGLTSLVLMIFSSIYGFSNSLNAYFQMGYASIIWYVIAALLFLSRLQLCLLNMGQLLKQLVVGFFHGCEDRLVKSLLLLAASFG